MADFGEILKNIGEYGTFQKLLLTALSFPYFIQPFVLASAVFLQSDPDRHCNTDWILRLDSNLSSAEQLNLTLPRQDDGTFSRCLMFVPVDWDIGDIRDRGLNETTRCRDGWVYHDTLYQATIITDFDLVCGRAYLVQVVQAVFLAGVLLGAVLFGPVAESLGRKRTSQTTLVLCFIFITLTALSPNVYVYLFSQFMVAVGYGGYAVNSVILATEWMGPSNRSWGACMSELCSAIAQCVLAVVMYLARDWRLVQLITVAPVAVGVLYIWFIPESARWLLSRGRTEEAKQLIVKAAAVNQQTVPDSLLDNIIVKDVKRKEGIKVIFTSSVLTRYLFIITSVSFSVTMSITSLYLNMGDFSWNIFVTQFLFGATEIIAHILCMWLLEVFGRRRMFAAALLAGGLGCVLVIAVPPKFVILVSSIAVVSRFFLIWGQTISKVFVQELFPTSVRQTATALGVISGRIGALLAPVLNLLSAYHHTIPTAVFSSITLFSGALCFLLPETKSKDLPESADELENDRHGTKATSTKL